MSKQVEVPEGIREALRGLSDEGRASYHGLMDGGLAELLPAIYKHFSDRLLSDEAIKAGSAAAFVEVSALLESDIRAAIKAALQAASIPEEDRG